MSDAVEIGFVGLGRMGGALATRLLAADVELWVHDPDVDAQAALERRGAHSAPTARVVADRCGIVFTCLPSVEACVDVAFAIADGDRIDLHVECSTVGRAGMARIVAAHPRVDTVDAPISGGPKGAQAGTLSAIVSGAPNVVAKARPWLDRLARRVFVMGDRPGDAQIAKIINNALSISAMAVSCEAIVLGVKAGLDAGRLVEMINVSTGRNSATVDKFPKAILPRTFDYGGALAIGTKDLALYLDEAAAEGLPAWMLSNTAQFWRFAVDRLGPDADLTEVVRVVEDWAGVEVRGRAGPPSEENP